MLPVLETLTGESLHVSVLPHTLLGVSSNYHKMPSLCSPFSTVQGSWSLGCHREPKNKIQTTRAFKYQPTKGGIGINRLARLSSLPFLGPGRPGLGAPRRDTAPPRGTARWLLCCAPRAGNAPSSPGRGGFTSRRGVRTPRPAESHSAPRGLSDRPRGGKRRLALGAARSPAESGVGGGAAPAGVGQPKLLPVCQKSVGPSVCAPGSRTVQNPAESAPCSPAAAGAWEARLGRSHLGLPRGPPGRVESRGCPRGPLVGARSPRRCRCLLLGRLLQVPSPSAPLARWLPGRLRASAGGRGRRRRGGRKEGVSSLGMGKARRGSGRE